MSRGLHIGKAAEQTGLSIDTIRFYEKVGLLQKPPRSEGGYRMFGPNEIGDLRFIGKAQELGFSLNEIRELLLVRRQDHACAPVRELLRRKLDSVRQKIEELLRLEAELKQALRKCEREIRTSAVAGHECCPVLAEMESVNGKRRLRHES